MPPLPATIHAYAIGRMLQSLSICEKFCASSPTIKQKATLQPHTISRIFSVSDCVPVSAKPPNTNPKTSSAITTTAETTVPTVLFISFPPYLIV